MGRTASSKHPAVLRCVYFRTFPLKCSHGRIGIVTDLGPRLYMVNGSPRVRKYEVDSSSLGVTVAGKWRSAQLRQEDPWGKQELSGKLRREPHEETAPHVTT